MKKTKLFIGVTKDSRGYKIGLHSASTNECYKILETFGRRFSRIGVIERAVAYAEGRDLPAYEFNYEVEEWEQIS